MPQKEIDYIKVGKVKSRRKKSLGNHLLCAADWVIDQVSLAVAIIGAGCLAGIGFGAGLSLVTTLL